MGAFADKVKAFANKAQTRIYQTKRESIILLAQALVDRSPVGDPALWASPAPKGYIPGTFKANWQGGDGEINFDITDDADPSGEVSMISIISKIPEQLDGEPFYITNSLPYSIALENGWSHQAPAGIVALTKLEWQNIVNIATTSVIGGVIR